MRYLLSIILLLSFNACQEKKPEHKEIASSQKNGLLTKVSFINKYQDFGILSNDTTVSAKFHFKNTGKNKLIVDYVDPDCTCTGYRINKDTVETGDSAFIRLDFNTKHKYGKQKIYTIVSMNTQEKLYKLMFTADVQ